MPTETFFNLDERKRDKIITAALEEFELYTLKGAKVVRIIKKVNISRASFYKYFDGLEELYFYILGEVLKRWFEVLKEELKKVDGDMFLAIRNVFVLFTKQNNEKVDMLTTIYDSNYIPSMLYVKGLGSLFSHEIKELYDLTDRSLFRDQSIGFVMEVYESLLSVFLMHLIEINLGFRSHDSSIKSFDVKMKFVKNGAIR